MKSEGRAESHNSEAASETIRKPLSFAKPKASGQDLPSSGKIEEMNETRASEEVRIAPYSVLSGKK